VSERAYKGVVLGRKYALPLTDDDAKIFYSLGPGVRAFYGRSDRGDAEKIFAAVDSAPALERSDNCVKKKEDLPDRGM
jgi:hypothetical protein